MKQTAVEYFVEQLEAIGFSTNNIAEFENEIILAKEMEKQHNISLLEWIRENAVEVQEGWQYLGKVYTDKQIIEIYNQTFKSK
jgi:hypothetical protein